MYAHKSNIIMSAFKVDKDCILDSLRERINVKKGDYIATNLLGEQLVFSEEYVKAMSHIEVSEEPKETREMNSDIIKGRSKKEFRNKMIEDYMMNINELSKISTTEWK